MMTKPRLKAKLQEGKVYVAWTPTPGEDDDEGNFTLKTDLIPEEKRRVTPPSAPSRMGAFDLDAGRWHPLGIPVTKVITAELVEE